MFAAISQWQLTSLIDEFARRPTEASTADDITLYGFPALSRDLVSQETVQTGYCFAASRFSYVENFLHFNFMNFPVECADCTAHSRHTFSSVYARGTSSFAAETTDFIAVLCSL